VLCLEAGVTIKGALITETIMFFMSMQNATLDPNKNARTVSPSVAQLSSHRILNSSRCDDSIMEAVMVNTLSGSAFLQLMSDWSFGLLS
jgi:hypothetical protein